jgi:hypothetical protein
MFEWYKMPVVELVDRFGSFITCARQKLTRSGDWYKQFVNTAYSTKPGGPP